MKLVAHNDSSLERAVHVNELLKAGIFAIDEALKERQEISAYDCNLFNGMNPDHSIPFCEDQAILYDFSNHLTEEVGLALFHSLGIRFSILLHDEESMERQWDKIKNITERLMSQSIYFLVKNDI